MIDWWWTFGLYVVAWVSAGLAGMSLGRVLTNRIDYKHQRHMAAISLTSRQRSRIVQWIYHTQGSNPALAHHLLNCLTSVPFDKHMEALRTEKNALALYPSPLRSRLYDALYPNNGIEGMAWLRTNHPNIYKEYRLYRRAKVRLLGDK